jgi:hypothetical protein
VLGALRIDIKTCEQLLEVDIQVVRKRAGDMPLEQKGQGNAGNRERNQDRREASGDEAQAERVPSHTCDSATM